jgi:hypothetical protein
MAHWHDAVHYVGIAGAGLAILVFLGGATLYLGFNLPKRPFKHPLRRRIRIAHMSGGALAVTLALTHYVGRRIQAGEYGFEMAPPFFAGALFLLVGLSGVLRYWTPKPWRKRWMIFAYIHRLAVVGALCMVISHALHELAVLARRIQVRT